MRLQIPIREPNIKKSETKNICLDISQYFGENHDLYMTNFGHNGHEGADFSLANLSPKETYGWDVLAAHDGIVTKVCWGGEHYSNGNGIYIKSLDGKYETIYWHLSEIRVSVNQRVVAGQHIGDMGNSGFVRPMPTKSNPYAGTHLHFALRLYENNKLLNQNNGYGGCINPLPYFAELQCMLKLIGDKSTNKQYIVGDDRKLIHLIDEKILHFLQANRVIQECEWLDDFPRGFEITEKVFILHDKVIN